MNIPHKLELLVYVEWNLSEYIPAHSKSVMMVSNLIRRSLTTSSRMMVRAKVPVFSSSDMSKMMVTQPGPLEKANLMMFGTPNRAETGDFGLDISIEEWKAGALTGASFTTIQLISKQSCQITVGWGDWRSERRTDTWLKLKRRTYSSPSSQRTSGPGERGSLWSHTRCQSWKN